MHRSGGKVGGGTVGGVGGEGAGGGGDGGAGGAFGGDGGPGSQVRASSVIRVVGVRLSISSFSGLAPV